MSRLKKLYTIYIHAILPLVEVPKTEKCDVQNILPNQVIYSKQTMKYVHVNIENASSFKSGDIKS